jgi:[NiFe] hydrogenase assembly HybE family chaperone
MSTDLAASPGARLEAAFRRVALTRMHDIPILNPALGVEAIGLRRWRPGSVEAETLDGPFWLGILLTPWFMNLLLLPAGAEALPAVPPGGEIILSLPGGDLPFMAGREDGIGEYRLCSLFSPVLQFADQDSARATALEVLRLLFPPPAPGTPDLSRRRLFGLTA